MHISLLCLAAREGQIRYLSSCSPNVLEKVIISQRRRLCDRVNGMCDSALFVPVQSAEQKFYDMCIQHADRLLHRIGWVQVCSYFNSGECVSNIAETCNDSPS